MSRAWPDSVDVSGPEYDTKALYDNAGGAEKYYDFIPEPTPQKHMESWIDRRWPKGRWLYRGSYRFRTCGTNILFVTQND